MADDVRDRLIKAVEVELDSPGVLAVDIVDALLPVVGALARDGQAEAWGEGYNAAQLDADEEPYSDRPERATWQPRQNPYRAAALRAGGSA